MSGDRGTDGGSALYAVERQQALLATLRATGRIEAARAAEELRVTTETIRKDLSELEHQGLLRRVRGGAVAGDGLSFEPAVPARTEYTDEKKRIARRAVEELPRQGTILIDAGSTCTYFAEMIPPDRDLTVFTNTLTIALALVSRPRLTVYTTGGRVRERTYAQVEGWALRALREINVDVAFLGCNGIDVEAGLTTPDPAEADIKREMFAIAGRRVLLTDHSKIGHASLRRYGSVDDLDLMITDTGIARADAARLAAAGLELVRA